MGDHLFVFVCYGGLGYEYGVELLGYFFVYVDLLFFVGVVVEGVVDRGEQVWLEGELGIVFVA